MTNEEVFEAVQDAIRACKAEEPPLDFSGVHERAIAHRLAVHMEERFEGWNVDCEYDRDGQIQKAVFGIAACVREKKTDEIVPDIIVHHRRNEGRDHNLLIIEMKKALGDDACDIKKLELLTDQSGHFQYQFGLFINIGDGEFIESWFKDGQRIRRH